MTVDTLEEIDRLRAERDLLLAACKTALKAQMHHGNTASVELQKAIAFVENGSGGEVVQLRDVRRTLETKP